MTDMNAYTWHMPTEMVFGEGSFDSLGDHARRLGSRFFLVTGKHSARATGLLDRAVAQLPGCIVFDAVDENPGNEVCEAGARACVAAGCDGIVALGGGSPMDAAKAIAVLATNGGRCTDYFGRDQYTKAPLPIIAVPTTAGTGSEVTPYAVLVDAATRMKTTIAGAELFPKVALLDPAVTATMPRHVTIATGLDALSQGMEGYLSNKATPVSDVLALEATALVTQWLPIAADAPENLEARSAMLHASALAGMAIAQTGTTLVHGMGYYLTVEHGVAHGLANALLLAPVFRYNAHHAPERVAALATCLGDADAVHLATAVTRGIHALLDRLGVSPAAREHGVPDTRLGEFAAHIGADPYRLKNQIGAPDTEEIQRFYEEAWAGR